MKSQMTIGKRFTLTAAILISFIMIQGGLSLYLVHSLANSVETVAADRCAGVYRISQVASALQTLRGEAWKHIANTDAREKSTAEQAARAQKAIIDSNLADYEKTITTAEDRELFGKIHPS